MNWLANRLSPLLIIPFVLSALTLSLATPVEAVIHIGSPNTAALKSGLVAYWPLDGAVTDWKSGTTEDIIGGNTGQLIGISTSSSPVAGKIGQALSFNGTAGDVTIPNVTGLNNGGPATISGWIKASAQPNGAILDELYAGFNSIEIDARTDGSLNYFQNDNTFSQCFTSSGFLDGKWHFVTATQTANLRQIYFDGVLLCSDPVALDGISGPPTLYIGSENGASRFYNGTLDDLRIYNRVLSAQEIAQLYKQGTVTLAHSNIIHRAWSEAACIASLHLVGRNPREGARAGVHQ